MSGEQLYDSIYDARTAGTIGTTAVPWRDVPAAEQQVWDGLAAARPRLYGLTADEWLHLAAEGQDSEVSPCCGDISQLCEYLNALATCQGQGEAFLLWTPVLDSYETALASHDTLADEQVFPLLHRVLAGIRAELTTWQQSLRQYAETREQENQS